MLAEEAEGRQGNAWWVLLNHMRAGHVFYSICVICSMTCDQWIKASCNMYVIYIYTYSTCYSKPNMAWTWKTISKFKIHGRKGTWRITPLKKHSGTHSKPIYSLLFKWSNLNLFGVHQLKLRVLITFAEPTPQFHVIWPFLRHQVRWKLKK